jgi:hypothetical protein
MLEMAPDAAENSPMCTLWVGNWMIGALNVRLVGNLLDTASVGAVTVSAAASR